MVCFLAYENVNDLDVTGPTQSFHTASNYVSSPLYKVQEVSRWGDPVKTTAGLPIITRSISEVSYQAIHTMTGS